jgi:hypothetical protein
MCPVTVFIVKTSWVRLVTALSLKTQPLSVRKVKGICDTQPSANFFRILSGTRKAVLVLTKPGMRAGRFRAEDNDNALTSGTSCTDGIGAPFWGKFWNKRSKIIVSWL